MAAIFLLLDLLENEQRKKSFIQPRDINVLDDKEFRKLFRVPPRVYREVCIAVKEDLKRYDHDRSSIMIVEQQVLLALRFFGTGGSQQSIADDQYISCSQAQVSRTIHRVAKAIGRRLGHKISFPRTTAEKEQIKTDFYNLQGDHLRGVVGAVDGTLVEIKPPPAAHPRFKQAVFNCLQNYFAINPMVICDANLKILHVDVSCPGSVDDSVVWKMSNVKEMVPEIFGRDEWLLGDSGYPLEPWLLTPIGNPQTPHEVRYNVAHKSTRDVVERCIVGLKMRFRCLTRQRRLMYLPDKSATIIHACAILHNMCLEAEDDITLPTPDDDAALTIQIADRLNEPICRHPGAEERKPVQANATLNQIGVHNRMRLARSLSRKLV